MTALPVTVGASIAALWNIAGHYALLPEQLHRPATYVYGCAGILAGCVIDGAVRGKREIPLADLLAITAAAGVAVMSAYAVDAYRIAQARNRAHNAPRGT
jgi:hypothetical protein